MDKVVQQMSNAWWVTPNEKRQAMNYGIDEENEVLNDYFIPSNLIPANSNDVDFPEPKRIDVNLEYENEEIYNKESKTELEG